MVFIAQRDAVHSRPGMGPIASPAGRGNILAFLAGAAPARTQVGNGLSHDPGLKTGFRVASEAVTWLDLNEPQFDTW